MSRYRIVILSFLSLALMVGGCSKRKQKAPQPDPGAMGSEGAGQPATGSEIQPHPGLVAAVKRAIPCIKKSSYQTTRCVDYDAARRLARLVSGEEDGDARVLVSLASVAAGADPQAATIAIILINDYHTQKAIRRLVEQKAVPKSAVLDLLQAYKKAKGEVSFDIAKGVAILAGAVGLHERLWAIAEKHSNPYSKKEILRHILSGARLAAYGIVAAQIESKERGAVVVGLAAPLNMPRWTAAEFAKLCPLGPAYIGHKDLLVAAAAAKLLVRCNERDPDKYLGLLIAEGRKRAKQGQWKASFVSAFLRLCDRESRLPRVGKVPPDPWCRKVFGLFEWVASQASVKDHERRRALTMIAHQESSPVALKILERYKNHANKAVREGARDGIDWIESNLKRR